MWHLKRLRVLAHVRELDTPIARAWTLALEARGEVDMAHQATGVLHAFDRQDWSRQIRDLREVRERLLVLAHLSEAIEQSGEGHSEGYLAALGRFFPMKVPPDRLEHVELHMVYAIVEDKPVPQGPRVQLSWRGLAAGALAWALGIFGDLDEATRSYAELSQAFEGCDPNQPLPTERIRTLAEIETALQAVSEGLDAVPPSAERSIRIEQVKALRWLIEPWWPELAFTPWDALTLQPKRFSEFNELAVLARTHMFQDQGIDPSIRHPVEVGDMAVSLLVHGAYPMHALHLDFDLVDGGFLRQAEFVEISPTDPLAIRGFQAARDGLAIHPDDALRCIWLSAAADALLWALGMLVDLPEDDPLEEDLDPIRWLFAQWPEVREGCGLRPKYLIEREWLRWNQARLASTQGSRAFSFAAERCRALRWILEAWPSVSETPWDDSNQVVPYLPVEP